MNKQNKRMYRLISILIIIITLLFNIQKANADDSDNSCIDIGSFGDSVKRYTATLGFYNIVNNGFSMTDPSAEGSPATDSNGNVTTRCKVPTSDVTFIYNTSICNSGVKSFKVGDSENVCGAWFRAVQENDKICVQVLLTYGYVDIGCKYTISPASTSSACAENSTVPAKSCIGSLPNSKSLIPITGLVVSCVKDSIDSLFNNPTNIDCNGNLKNNLFNNVQNGVRNIVKLLLTLYVIFFGIKIALGQDLPKKGEVFIFIMKMILVMYFSVGIPISNKSGNVVYENGISANTTNPTGFESILSKGFGAIGESLSNIIIGAANKSNGLCYYNQENPIKIDMNIQNCN